MPCNSLRVMCAVLVTGNATQAFRLHEQQAGVHTDGMHYVLLLAIQRTVRFPYNPIAVTLSTKSPGLY